VREYSADLVVWMHEMVPSTNLKGMILGKIYVFKHIEKFVYFTKKMYLCQRYPEYNLFTLKKETNTYLIRTPPL